MDKINKNHNIFKKTAFSLLFAVFFVIIDLFIKIFAINNLQNTDILLAGDIFKLSLAKNTGIAFSIPLPPMFLSIFIGIIIVLLIGFYIKEVKNKNEQYLIPLTFIIIGAIMNFVDRLRFGYVIDYFNLKWFTVFNLADCLIVGGSFLFILKNFYERKNGKYISTGN